MVFEKIKEQLSNWWSNVTMSSEERWLSQSADVVELENKLRQLCNTKNDHYPFRRV